MSKELIERIMDYTSRHRRTAPQVCDILTACKQRIEEMQSDINGWLVIKGNMTKHQQELEQQLRLEKQLLAAVKHTVVATIGGVDYEGYPTSEINYLQRLRILVEKEQENSRLKAELASAMGKQNAMDAEPASAQRSTEC